MANGRTFRPGPRVEYRQKPLRFNDDTLSTAAIASPLDVAAAPGGTLWRQGRPHRRTRPTIQVVRHVPGLLPIDPFSGQAAWTDDADTCVAAGTFYDPIVTDGGTRQRHNRVVVRRLPHRAPFYQHRPPVIITAENQGSCVWTEDDDTCVATGTHTDPAYGDGGVRARHQRVALRRFVNRAPFSQRRPPAFFIDANQGAVNWTEDDDTCAASGTHTDPAYGDGLIRQRAQSSRHQRPRARNQYCQPRRRDIPEPPVVVASVPGRSTFTYTNAGATFAYTAADVTLAITAAEATLTLSEN